ncbi:hypothetical protein [Lysinibacillus agricola]|uniref:hypothetical protein n=1 Tax=Lysinibacillus agricola TaxID=2590012 RepID=UPI003C1FD4AC
MDLLNKMHYLISFDFGIVMNVLEILLVTACTSTIIFILTKNQYLSCLSSAPLFYIFSSINYGFTHFIFLVLSMTIQTGIILLINRQRKKLLLNAPKGDLK